MRATGAVLSPAVVATGGAVKWFVDGIPSVVRPDRGETTGGRAFALVRNHVTRVVSVEQIPLLPPWWALIFLIGALGLAWRREGK